MYQFQGRQPDEKIIQNVYLFFFFKCSLHRQITNFEEQNLLKSVFFFLKLYFYKYRITKKISILFMQIKLPYPNNT